MTCKSCRFYEGEQFGNCRRYPKQIMKQHSGWCGEHSPIAVQEAEKEAPKERKKREPKTSA